MLTRFPYLEQLDNIQLPFCVRAVTQVAHAGRSHSSILEYHFSE